MKVIVLGDVEPVKRSPAALPDVQYDESVLDLSPVKFVCPLDLVAIAAWAAASPQSGRVVLPNGPTASYLERMRLLEFLRSKGWAVPHIETGPWQDLAHRLLEVTPLHDPYAVDELADRLPRLWASHAGDPSKRRALHFAFGELCDNAITHSGGSPIFVAAQRYTGVTSGGPPRIELAVADAGIGIRRHLTSNPQYAEIKDDLEAISRALEPGVTGTRDRRGYGLHDVLNEMRGVGSGELIVLSGAGEAVVCFDESGLSHRGRSSAGSVRGTWVQARINE